MNDSPRRGHKKVRSHKLDGETAVDYALGFGVWGLAVGDVVTPIHRQLVEGAAGAFNSIAIADLVGADGKPEVYIAGSSGLRRFDL